MVECNIIENNIMLNIDVNHKIKYIDAMRGFVMLLVVYSHILYYGYASSFSSDISMGGECFLSFHSLSVIYMVPLFFVISGFMLSKNIILGTFSCSLRFIYRKMKFLLFQHSFFYLFTHL